MLPQTGPSDIVDVSALRALYQPAATTTAIQDSSIVRETRGVQALLFAGAALLSLMGAIGSAVYSLRRKAVKA